MKILFSTRPAYGHVYPLLPLALAARDAGHDVTFATTGPFLADLAALGFEVHDVGISIEAARDALLRDLADLAADGMPTDVDGRPDLDIGGRLFLEIVAPATVAGLTPLLPAVAPDVVVYEQYELGAGVAARAAGIPAVCHALSPVFTPEAFSAIVRRRPHGPIVGDGWHHRPDFDVFTGDLFLDIIPDALQSPSFVEHPARLRVRPVPFTDPGASVPSWIGRTAGRSST